MSKSGTNSPKGAEISRQILYPDPLSANFPDQGNVPAIASKVGNSYIIDLDETLKDWNARCQGKGHWERASMLDSSIVWIVNNEPVLLLSLGIFAQKTETQLYVEYSVSDNRLKTSATHKSVPPPLPSAAYSERKAKDTHQINSNSSVSSIVETSSAVKEDVFYDSHYSPRISQISTNPRPIIYTMEIIKDILERAKTDEAFSVNIKQVLLDQCGAALLKRISPDTSISGGSTSSEISSLLTTVGYEDITALQNILNVFDKSKKPTIKTIHILVGIMVLVTLAFSTLSLTNSPLCTSVSSVESRKITPFVELVDETPLDDPFALHDASSSDLKVAVEPPTSTEGSENNVLASINKVNSEIIKAAYAAFKMVEVLEAQSFVPKQNPEFFPAVPVQYPRIFDSSSKSQETYVAIRDIVINNTEILALAKQIYNEPANNGLFVKFILVISPSLKTSPVLKSISGPLIIGHFRNDYGSILAIVRTIQKESGENWKK